MHSDTIGRGFENNLLWQEILLKNNHREREKFLIKQPMVDMLFSKPLEGHSSVEKI